MKMTQMQIEQYARKFLKDNYKMDLNIPITINGRLSRSLGKFVHRAAIRESVRIEISKKHLMYSPLDDILSTIRHECIHYALFELGKPYRDGDVVFESELRKHGAKSTGTTKLLYERNVNVYRCKCEKAHYTRRALKNNGRNHRCTICKTGLKYEGKKLVKC